MCDLNFLLINLYSLISSERQQVRRERLIYAYMAWQADGNKKERQSKNERLREKGRHPMVGNGCSFHQFLFKHFILLLWHLTEHSKTGKWLENRSSLTHSDIHTQSTCHHLRSQLKKVGINKCAHTHTTPREWIRRGIVLTRQVPEDERTLKAYFAISNPQCCVSHMHKLSLSLFYTHRHMCMHTVCVLDPLGVLPVKFDMEWKVSGGFQHSLCNRKW